ncbi:ATP-binding protein [Streptomyces sp. NPDC017890]|uniref:ATP-binding protein n=1 Tax=Streptomyces sp. NPDC017890 TaxID=3365015 RepID=UPI0037B64662
MSATTAVSHRRTDLLLAEGGPVMRRPSGAVSDGGEGIPDSVLPHVFDRFCTDSARARSEGSGLGPAITTENARLHGGTLRAANHPHGGAVFTVVLPLRPDGVEDGAAHAAKEEQP